MHPPRDAPIDSVTVALRQNPKFSLYRIVKLRARIISDQQGRRPYTEMRLQALFHRLVGSASTVLIAVLLVMAAGIFGLLGMQLDAEGATAASRDLLSVAAAAEEMSGSSAEISRQVSGVTAAVRQAVDRASIADQKVAGLAASANLIGEVVVLISDIASRTNLPGSAVRACSA